MPSTSKMGWIYPTEGRSSWMTIFESMMSNMDSDVYAALEDPSLILSGGGTIALNTNDLSWSSDIEILSMLTGGVITIVAGSLDGFIDGKIAYVTVSRPVNGSAIATLALGDYIDDRNKIMVAFRRGSAVYVRTLGYI